MFHTQIFLCAQIVVANEKVHMVLLKPSGESGCIPHHNLFSSEINSAANYSPCNLISTLLWQIGSFVTLDFIVHGTGPPEAISGWSGPA